MSWQRPNGPEWRGFRARAGALSAALGVGVLLVLAGLPTRAQPAYELLGQPAPDFALRAATGSNVRLSEHRGEVVVVSFWSSRCTPCRSQLGALNRSFQTYRSAWLVVYGVGVDDEPRQSLEFARSTGVSFPMLLDPSKDVARNYQVDNLPMTLLIDRNGIIRYVLRDYSDANTALYLQELRALLNE